MEMTEAERVDHIRKRPGMYLGGTTPRALAAMVLEVVSNSFDVVLAGEATRIDVAVDAAGAVTITDDGPGMGAADPTGAVLRSYFTRLRDTPTADGHWPHVHLSVGTGLGPVCALSSAIELEARRTDATFRQSFARGVATSELERTAGVRPDATGTTTRLTPDPEIFGDERIDLATLALQLEELALLQPGLMTTLTTPGAGREVFGPYGDLRDLFERRFARQRSGRSPSQPILLSKTGDDFAVDLVLAWSDHRHGTEIESYGNYRELSEQAWEVDGIEEGLREVLGPFPVRDWYRGAMAGLLAVLHVRLLDPKFPGPTRSRLESPEATWVVADLIADQLPAHLDQHPELRASLVGRTNTRTLRPG